ncbi:MAG: translocation/assembly module TamB domain-containing protein [Acidobacteriota bacterium]
MSEPDEPEAPERRKDGDRRRRSEKRGPDQERRREERRRPGRVRRWVVRPAVWGLLFLVLLAAAAWVFLESAYAHRRAVSLVIARAQELLNRKIEVGSVDYNFALLAFELHDVVVHGPRPGDPAFATVPLVRVEFSWRDLRQRILRLEQIEIVRPRVYLRFNPDGTNNLPELRTRKGAKRRFEVQIGRILVQDGVLDLDEHRLPLNLDAKAVWGRATGSAERGGEGPGRIDAMVTAQEVVTTLPHAKPYKYTASAKGSFVPGRIQFTALRIAGPDLKAQATGSYEWKGKDRRLGLEVTANGWAQLANRLGYAELPLQGPVDFRGRIDRAGETLSYSGTVRSPRFTALGRVFQDIEAGLVGGRDGLELDVERSVYAGGTVEGLISVDYGNKADTKGEGRPVDLDLSLGKLDFRKVIADQFGEGLPVVSDLSGRVSGDLVYHFEAGDPIAGSGYAEVHLDAVHRLNRLPISGDASVAIEHGVLASDNIRLTAPAQSVRGTNFLFDMERGAGHFDFQLASRDVGPLAPLLRGEVKPGEEPAFWVPDQGWGEAAGTVAIENKRFDASIRLNLNEVASPVVTADNVHGTLRYVSARPAAVEDLRLEATADDGALIITGRVPLEEEGRPAPGPLALSVDAHQWPSPGIVAFLAPALKDAGIDGRVSGRLDLSGTPDNLTGRTDIEMMDLRIAGVDLGRLQSGISFQGSRVMIDHAVGQTPAGTVLVSGSFDTESKALDLTVDAPELSLAAQPFRDLLGDLDVTGQAAVAATIGGTLDKPSGTASVRGTRLAVAGRPLGQAGEAQAGAAWDGETLTASGSLLGLATFEGGGRLTTENADLKFDLRSDSLGELAGIAAPQPLPGLTGSLSGSVGLVSDFGAGTWRAELALSDLRAQYQGHSIANREPVVVELTPGRVELRSLYLGEPGTENELFATGTIGLGAKPGDTSPLDLRVQSTLSAAWAELALPPGFDVDGSVDVLAVVRGTVSDPRVDGQGVIRGARFLVPELSNAFENVQGVVLFNRDAVVLDNLRADLGEGTVRATGSIDLPGPDRPDVTYRLQVAAEGVSLRYPEPFILRGDADLSLVASSQSRQIRGEVRLDRAYFLQDIQTETLQILLQALQRERLEVAETDELLANTQLSVRILGPNALRVRNNVADLRGKIDLDLRGTLAAPVVFGTVEAFPGGKLVYSDNDYEVERFLLTFNNLNRIDPTIDLVARTEVRNYDITLNLSGTLDRLNTQFTSDEGLADLEVLALLFGGEELSSQQVLPRAPGERSQEQDVGAQSFLAGQAASLVSKRVNTLFGFDRFRIDPQTNETGGSLGGVRLTAGKRISRDVFVTYSTNPASSEEYILRIEWQVARNVVLVFTRNGKDDTYAVDAEWEKRY